jgi:hypothetical protein
MTRGYGRYNITGGYGMIYPYYIHTIAIMMLAATRTHHNGHQL